MGAEKIALLVSLLSFIAFLSGRSLRIAKGKAMPDKAAKGKAMPDKAATLSWSELDISDLRLGFRDNMSVSDIAGYLLRTEEDVREKARELGIRLNVI